MVSDQSDNIIALYALFVSLFSVAFTVIITIYTLWIQRRHDHLSVKPIADIHYNNLNGHLSIILKNGGLGPMKINSLDTYKTIDVKKQSVGWPPKTFEDVFIGKHATNPIFLTQLENTPLSNGSSLNLFLLEYDVNNPIQAKTSNTCREALKELTIQIKYTSIYENEIFERDVPLHNFYHKY